MQIIQRDVRNGRFKDTKEEVWLVLEEDPVRRNGYQIVYSEERDTFGLTSPGFPEDRLPVLCGWYGDFPNTLSSM
jgi:hypothetical protein